MATMPKIVVVSGPLVRYSLSTSVVAAGAVAVQIAPRTSPSEIENGTFFVNRNVIAKTRKATTTNGTVVSPMRMPTNCFPYFLMTLIFSSAPTRNPMRERATVLIGSRAEISWSPRTLNPDAPIMIPTTIAHYLRYFQFLKKSASYRAEKHHHAEKKNNLAAAQKLKVHCRRQKLCQRIVHCVEISLKFYYSFFSKNITPQTFKNNVFGVI